MSCCSREKTDGKEPQSTKVQSDQTSEKIKIILPKKSSIPLEIEYSITIKTGNNQNSNTDGPVYINILGPDGKQTDDVLLKGPFKQDSITKIQIKAIDIGKPQRVIIRHEDKTNGWFIDYVEISVHNFLIRFVANRWLNESKHDRKLSTELFGSEQPAADYNIEIRTGSEQIEPFDSPVYIQIYGTITTTPKLFLESKYAKDTIEKFNISSNNVGEIQKIVIGHENLGTINDWYLEYVKVQTAGQQYEFPVNQWLSPTRDGRQLFVELTYEPPRTHSPALETYLITTKSVDIHRTDAIDNIQMSIIGSNGRVDKILLKNFIRSSNEQEIFQKGSSNEFEIKENDIGDVIESLTIGFDDHEQRAALLFESIDINYKNTIYHFRVECWLSSRLGPNFSWITIKPDTNNDEINYKVHIDTGESNIDSNIILCIYGDEDTTKSLALRTTKNSRLEFDLKAIDVGKIKKINIGHDGKGNEQQWFLKSIEIEKNDEHYIFKANQWLNEETGTFIDLLPEEPKPPSPEQVQVIYTITIVTSSENDSGTDSGVFMTMYGDKGRTEQFQLISTRQDSDLLFKPGETNEFKIALNDIGKINKINIGQDGKGLHPIWHLETIQIQQDSEIFKFHADQVLDLSMPDIDLTPISTDKKKSSGSVSSGSSTSRSRASRKKVKIAETTYEVLAQFRSLQKPTINNEAKLYLIIVGSNDQTEKLFLSNDKESVNKFTTIDIGKISKILLGQDKNPYGIVWDVESLTIKRDNETTIFNVERFIKQDAEIEVLSSAIHTPSEMPTVVVKTRDILYEIKTTTGEKTFEGDVTVKIRGEFGIINIPLSKTVSGEKPFRSKAIDVFTSRTNDVGKIKRLTVETTETRPNHDWYLKRIQIIKGTEIYHFNANLHLDYKEQTINLYPITKRKEDYVQRELRKLRESLRSESAKMHRPPHKAHEPFVYNDLSPYFDTTIVERAIHEPLESPTGYYTRLTALRVVEPWEAFGMDYGVSYELLKHRNTRSHSVKRSTKRIDDTIDRRQGSTYLPEFPCVNIQKPAEYQRPLNLNDVPKIRSFVRSRSTANADGQIEKDYKRTRDDFYRMQLDNIGDHHETNRNNMIRTYQCYLPNTPGSKKALLELCAQIPLNATKTTAV